ncbi:hypothetical protein [Microbacterium sp. K36]|uniref:hypothetical protein n=1 Tax=Microbacterium sp. K36 TaxID=2305439 RepID=UPI00109C026F|nr:hypothetical protein [Microbacterium sp. K36]
MLNEKDELENIADALRENSPIVGATLMLLHAHSLGREELIERAESAFDLVAEESRVRVNLMAATHVGGATMSELEHLGQIIEGVTEAFEEIGSTTDARALRSRLRSVAAAVRDLAQITRDVLAR